MNTVAQAHPPRRTHIANGGVRFQRELGVKATADAWRRYEAKPHLPQLISVESLPDWASAGGDAILGSCDL